MNFGGNLYFGDYLFFVVIGGSASGAGYLIYLNEFTYS